MRRVGRVRWLSTDSVVESLLKVSPKAHTDKGLRIPSKFHGGGAQSAALVNQEAQLNHHHQAVKDWLSRLSRPQSAFLDVSTNKTSDLQVPSLPLSIDMGILAKPSDAQQMVAGYGQAILEENGVNNAVVAAVGQVSFLSRTPSLVAAYVGAYTLMTNKLPQVWLDAVRQTRPPRRFKLTELPVESISNRNQRLEGDISGQFPKYPTGLIDVVRHIVQVKAADAGLADTDVDSIVAGILPSINSRAAVESVDDQLSLYRSVTAQLKSLTSRKCLFLSQLIMEKKIPLAQLPEPASGPLVPPVPRQTWQNRFHMIPQGSIHPRDGSSHWKQQQVVKDALGRAVRVGRLEWEFWVNFHFEKDANTKKLLLSQGFMGWAVDAIKFWQVQPAPDLRLRFQSSVTSDQFYQLIYCLTVPERLKYVARVSQAFREVQGIMGPQMRQVTSRLSTFFNDRVGGVDELAVAATVAKLGRIKPSQTLTKTGELGRQYCDYHAAKFHVGFRLHRFLVQGRSTMAVFDQCYGPQFYEKIGEAVIRGIDVDGLISDEIERVAHVKPGTLEFENIPHIRLPVGPPAQLSRLRLPIQLDSDLSKLLCLYYQQCRSLLAQIDPELTAKPYVNQLPDTISKLATVAHKYYRVQVERQQMVTGKDLRHMVSGEYAFDVIEATIDWSQSAILRGVHADAQRTPYHKFRYARQMMAQLMGVLYLQHPSMVDHWVEQQAAGSSQ
ncbi:hypothetical protein DIURU_003694 [Diutina rugosa]|uniref:Uncharacterized protein n=1 Tax=Diutina rugosa TaxID=5481 RepID=A0A642UKB7_DIURU|nr:uncharacterized protein DIURU_003694 [Diutina rugosa]KAA8900712.1 hypothetical protein DIURU_003694 [Diutina rugosa]